MPNIAELWLSAPHQRIWVMPSLHWGKLIGYWYFLRNFDQSVIKNCVVECKREWTCARMKSYTWEKRSNAGQRKGKAGLNSLHWKRCGEQEEQTTEKKKRVSEERRDAWAVGNPLRNMKPLCGLVISRSDDLSKIRTATGDLPLSSLFPYLQLTVTSNPQDFHSPHPSTLSGRELALTC